MAASQKILHGQRPQKNFDLIPLPNDFEKSVEVREVSWQSYFVTLKDCSKSRQQVINNSMKMMKQCTTGGSLAHLDFLEEGLCFLILLKMLPHRHQYFVDSPAEGRLQVTCSCHQI